MATMPTKNSHGIVIISREEYIAVGVCRRAFACGIPVVMLPEELEFTFGICASPLFARDSIYAKRAYAIAIPSVCPSVCLSHG